MAKDNFDDCYSVLDQDQVDAFCAKFYIPRDLHPLSPDPDKLINQPPEGMIGVYTRFFDYANMSIPFSRFLLSVIQYHNFHISQFCPLGALKVSCFEIQCRAFQIEPTLPLFRKLYKLGRNGYWVTINLRDAGSAPVCITQYPTSLKFWKDRFFWIKASAVPIHMIWKPGNVSLEDDMPTDIEAGERNIAILESNKIRVRHFNEHALVIAGISRRWDEPDAIPCFSWKGKGPNLKSFTKLFSFR